MHVPRQKLVVEAEENWFVYLINFFDHSRSYVGAHGFCLAQSAMEQAISYVKERKQFGQTIGSFKVIR